MEGGSQKGVGEGEKQGTLRNRLKKEKNPGDIWNQKHTLCCANQPACQFSAHLQGTGVLTQQQCSSSTCADAAPEDSGRERSLHSHQLHPHLHPQPLTWPPRRGPLPAPCCRGCTSPGSHRCPLGTLLSFEPCSSKESC